MTMHWSAGYLGWTYRRGAQGPAEWDCWSFFRHVEKMKFGRDLPAMPTPPTLFKTSKVMPTWAAEFGWVRTEQPVDGDAVFLSQLRMPTHIGVWLGDLRATLHCAVGGSVLHDARHLAAAQWQVRGYFTPEA